MRTLGLESWLNDLFAYQQSKAPILAVGNHSIKDRLIRPVAAANRGEVQSSNPEKAPGSRHTGRVAVREFSSRGLNISKLEHERKVLP